MNEHATVTLTAANFDEVTRSTQPVLVDAWATWCGPCKMLAPVLDEIARESVGRFVIGKLDVDANPELAARLSIKAMPTLLFFKDGAVRDTVVGMTSKKTIVSKLEALAGTPVA
ncbi:MAG TPA: thioredoxin [Chthoniobacteraceae bacterium]|jgi:thioredoxin 1